MAGRKQVSSTDQFWWQIEKPWLNTVATVPEIQFTFQLDAVIGLGRATQRVYQIFSQSGWMKLLFLQAYCMYVLCVSFRMFLFLALTCTLVWSNTFSHGFSFAALTVSTTDACHR
jgi:hypothetical protein